MWKICLMTNGFKVYVCSWDFTTLLLRLLFSKGQRFDSMLFYISPLSPWTEDVSLLTLCTDVLKEPLTECLCSETSKICAEMFSKMPNLDHTKLDYFAFSRLYTCFYLQVSETITHNDMEMKRNKTFFANSTFLSAGLASNWAIISTIFFSELTLMGILQLTSFR